MPASIFKREGWAVKESTFRLIGVFSLLLAVRLIYFAVTKRPDLAEITGQAPIAVALTLGLALAVEIIRHRFAVRFYWRAAFYFILSLLLHLFIHVDFSFFTSPVLAVVLFLPPSGEDIDFAATAVTLVSIVLLGASLLLGSKLVYTILLISLYAALSFLIKGERVSIGAKG